MQNSPVISTLVQRGEHSIEFGRRDFSNSLDWEFFGGEFEASGFSSVFERSTPPLTTSRGEGTKPCTHTHTIIHTCTQTHRTPAHTHACAHTHIHTHILTPLIWEVGPCHTGGCMTKIRAKKARERKHSQGSYNTKNNFVENWVGFLWKNCGEKNS